MRTTQNQADKLAAPIELNLSNRITLRKGEAASVLGISERKLHDLLKSDQLTSLKVGRAVLIPVAELQAFISNRLEGQEGGCEI